MERKTLRELVSQKQIFAPIIWDVMSAKCAEMAGFEATLLSGGVVAGNCATPDIGLITSDDLVRVTGNVCRASALPCCIDADDGYGETPLHAYHTTKRLAEAGAMSLTLDDTTGVRGYNRWGVQLRSGTPFGEIPHPTVSRDVFLAKTRAALDACDGTDCMLIARTEAALQYGLDEAIERCVRAEELGAEMTLIIGLMNLEQAQYVAKYVKGWKMWPDIMAPGGVPDVEFEDLEKLGFNYITAHCITKGAQYGMVSFGERVLKDKSTVYCDTHDMGLSEEERAQAFSLETDKEWFTREAKYWKGLNHPYLGKIEG
ncbi:MAG TPA: isocitrate lyase/PEP mutase family protein [Eubacteriales bacterium]|nr:isocitrate lyase/PEP mutase family protein [Eubacteriales bacterium]